LVTGWFLDRRRVLLFGAILLIAVALRWAAFSLLDTMHHDEILQYQERAYRMVFGRGIVPWETRYGARGALIPDLLAGAMALGALLGADHWTPVLTARLVFAGLCLAAVPAAYAVGALRSRTHGLVALFVAAIWYEAVLFGVHVLAESLATAFACCGVAALLRARDDRRAALLAGFLLAMTVLLRLQYAVFVATLIPLALRGDRAAWRSLAIGALPAFALGAASDLAAGMMPFSWAWTNVVMNTAGGRAAFFGVEDGAYYLRAMLVQLHPVAVPIAIGALFSGTRLRPVLIAALVTIAAHSLIGHKEYRFIWLPVFLLVILAAIAGVDLIERIVPTRRRTIALAGLCLVWSAASAWGYVQGRDRLSLAGTGRDGAGVASVAIRAAERPETCGLAVAQEERRSVAQVFMPRPVELYLFPDPVNAGRQSFDPALIAGANALIVTRGATPPPAYHRLSCRRERDRRLCLFVRAGGCDAAAGRAHTYQSVLIAHDL
jgi:hypothetical protein